MAFVKDLAIARRNTVKVDRADTTKPAVRGLNDSFHQLIRHFPVIPFGNFVFVPDEARRPKLELGSVLIATFDLSFDHFEQLRNRPLNRPTLPYHVQLQAVRGEVAGVEICRIHTGPK